MAIVPINVTEEQLFALYEVADSDYNGNVSEAIRSVLAKQYPVFAQAKQPRPRRHRKPLERAAANRFENMPVLVELTE